MFCFKGCAREIDMLEQLVSDYRETNQSLYEKNRLTAQRIAELEASLEAYRDRDPLSNYPRADSTSRSQIKDSVSPAVDDKSLSNYPAKKGK